MLTSEGNTGMYIIVVRKKKPSNDTNEETKAQKDQLTHPVFAAVIIIENMFLVS